MVQNHTNVSPPLTNICHSKFIRQSEFAFGCETKIIAISISISRLITNIAYNVHPKNLLLKWIFCPETSDDHKPLPIHSTKALNSYSVIFKDNSLSIQGNYATRIDLSDERKYILDVEKLASKILPRNVARECQLKDIIYKVSKQ